MDKGWYTRDFELRSDDPSRNMVRVGDAVSEELQKAGDVYKRQAPLSNPVN